MKRTREEKLFYYSQPGLYNKKIEELETAEEQVLHLLKHDPELRNDDTLLLFAYWRQIDGYKGELDQETLKGLTNFETIRRVRQKIQNEYYKFLPTKEDIIESRKICQKAIEAWTRESQGAAQ